MPVSLLARPILVAAKVEVDGVNRAAIINSVYASLGIACVADCLEAVIGSELTTSSTLLLLLLSLVNMQPKKGDER